MNIFERLPKEDIHQLYEYLRMYGDTSNTIPEENMDYFLRYWSEAKYPFFKAFGENFIIKREIAFEKSINELEDEMYHMRWDNDSAIEDFCCEYKEAIKNIFGYSLYNDNRDWLFRFVDSTNLLATNIYKGPALIIPAEYTKNSLPLTITPGCKAIKMLGKIVKALGIDENGYEKFRQAHSQVLNQKVIRGNMCLSIHPLDYLTMSDNNCGWTSCMSWMEDYGDYRLGTIEMMNSPCVIEAYVEAKDPMFVCTKDWSNKRWRQLYIATPELILGNRQYPYANGLLQGSAIKWVRDICEKIPGWGPYAEEATNICNKARNTIRGNYSVDFNIYCNYMYNDVYDSRLAYISLNFDKPYYTLNFSGPAVCVECGEIIEIDTVEADRVNCLNCMGYWICAGCGERCYGEQYIVENNYSYCSWCYADLKICSCCEEKKIDTSRIFIMLLDENHKNVMSDLGYELYVEICDDCLVNKEFEYLFGPIYSVKDNCGYFRQVFDFSNVTEDGFYSIDLSPRTVKYLQRIQNIESVEERLELFKKLTL